MPTSDAERPGCVRGARILAVDGTTRRPIAETLADASEAMGLGRDGWREVTAAQWALMRARAAESRVGGGR
jgi:hypothetical protein